jgi:hypothetical protein
VQVSQSAFLEAGSWLWEQGGHVSYLIQQVQAKQAILDFVTEHSTGYNDA